MSLEIGRKPPIVVTPFFLFLLSREDAANGLVEARSSMKDLVSCVHIVAKLKAFTFEVSRCHLADYVKELN